LFNIKLINFTTGSFDIYQFDDYGYEINCTSEWVGSIFQSVLVSGDIEKVV